MRDYVEIGPSPAGEDCVQLGTEDYAVLAREECKRFIEFIRKHKGVEPIGARLSIKSNAHDFGLYYEVVCYYDAEEEQAIEYAFSCEELPEYWDSAIAA